MCGIFGIISRQPIERGLFTRLGERNTERGNLAFGGLVVHDEQVNVFRFATPFDGGKVPLDGASIALGHVRAPTGGQPIHPGDTADVHPFETPDLLLAHNGLLLNHTQFPQWRINPTTLIDSTVIVGGIQHHLDQVLPIIEAIRATLEGLDGQQACWLWHKPSGDLYLWRVMSPIFVSVDTDRTIFSSVKLDFLKPAAQTALEEGIIYRLDRNIRNFVGVGTFHYYNPYKSANSSAISR